MTLTLTIALLTGAALGPVGFVLVVAVWGPL
jgi:hypothetical protein